MHTMICSGRRIGPSNLVGQAEAEVLEEGQKTWVNSEFVTGRVLRTEMMRKCQKESSQVRQVFIRENRTCLAVAMRVERVG